MPLIGSLASGGFGKGSGGGGGGGGGAGLYAFVSATFTTGGNTGPDGPSLTTARSGLTTTGAPDSWKNNTSFFNTSNGIQV